MFNDFIVRNVHPAIFRIILNIFMRVKFPLTGYLISRYTKTVLYIYHKEDIHMGWIVTLIVGGLIGWIAGAILGKDVPFGIIGNIVAGLVGASIGNALGLGIGPEIGGVSIIGGLIGAIILILVISFILKAFSKDKSAKDAQRRR